MMHAAMTKPLTKPRITIVSDGKPGHLAQSRGLTQAIARLVDVQTREVAVGERVSESTSDQQTVRGKQLVVAAGRRTYGPALKLARQCGGYTVALMNPGLRLRGRFDLCVIPRHDGVAKSNRVVITEGALNGIQRAEHADDCRCLLLIGGPSKHYHWDQDALIQQVRTLVAREAQTHWSATSSRRTPEATQARLAQIASQSGERFDFVPGALTPTGWVAEQLETCGVCWVSRDSVSMVYEALTAGAKVGLLSVPSRGRRAGRVNAGVTSLIDRGWVTTYERWLAGEAYATDRPALAEADRVASLIIERWLATTAD